MYTSHDRRYLESLSDRAVAHARAVVLVEVEIRDLDAEAWREEVLYVRDRAHMHRHRVQPKAYGRRAPAHNTHSQM
jgi:hypothetical protein